MGKQNHYLNNDRLEELIIAYKQDPSQCDELFSLFNKLISTIIESFKFGVDKEDARQDCFVLILKTIKNFDPHQGSAFNYFTTVIVNNLRLIYTKNKKLSERHNNYINWVVNNYKQD